MIINKNYIFGLILLLISILYQFGLRKSVFILFMLVIGYFIGHLSFKSDFLLGNLLTIFLNNDDNETNKATKNNSILFKALYKYKKKKAANNNNNDLNIRRSSSCMFTESSSSSDNTNNVNTTNNNNNNNNKTLTKNSNSYDFDLNDVDLDTSIEYERFRNRYPWMGLYLPENVDKSLENILSLVIRNFVLEWYSKISTDDGLVHEMKSLLRHVVASFLLRIQRINISNLLSHKLNTILFNHINEFLTHYNEINEKKLDKKLLNSVIWSENTRSKVHIALLSRRHELFYLRKSCSAILPHVLPDTYTHKSSLDLIEEIVVPNLLINGLDILAEPRTINQILIRLFSKSTTHYDSNVEYKSVEILKHWCQMNGCMFKTSLSPSVKDVFDNNEILHHFINYLHSQNSIVFLQLYLSLKEILVKTKHANNSELNLSSKENNNKRKQKQHQININPLNELKIWSNSPTNKYILKETKFNNNEYLYDTLNKIFNLNANNNNNSSNADSVCIDETTRDLLNDVFADVQSLIKDIYYSQFIKSEHVYKYLIGDRDDYQLPNANIMISSSYFKDGDNDSIKNGINVPNYDKNVFLELPNSCDTPSMSSHTNLNSPSSLQKIEEDALVSKILDSEVIEDLRDIIDSVSINSANAMLSNNINANYTDTDEDDDDNISTNQSLNIFNLNNLKARIDDIEELCDKSNKVWSVFVILVWNAKEPQQFTEDGECCTSWCVKRKYDEFYVLESRLKEFHGLFENLEIQLPAKKSLIFRSSHSLEFLHSTKNDFEKYLQSLLSNPILSSSELIRSFLDPQSIEFSSSIFNDISNLGKMVKGVPLKLRFERGQSLDPFLQYLVETVKAPKPKSSRTYVIYEDIVENKLNKDMYIDKTKAIDETKQRQEESLFKNSTTYTPYDSFLYLMNKIFKIPSILFLVLFSIRKLIQNTFNAAFSLVVNKKLVEIKHPEYLAHLIDVFNDLVFGDSTENHIHSGNVNLTYNNIINHDNNDKKNTNIDDKQIYDLALETMNTFIYEDIGSNILKDYIDLKKYSNNINDGNRSMLETFQYPLWNKLLTYKLLDALIEELFPEIDLNDDT